MVGHENFMSREGESYVLRMIVSDLYHWLSLHIVFTGKSLLLPAVAVNYRVHIHDKKIWKSFDYVVQLVVKNSVSFSIEMQTFGSLAIKPDVGRGDQYLVPSISNLPRAAFFGCPIWPGNGWVEAWFQPTLRRKPAQRSTSGTSSSCATLLAAAAYNAVFSAVRGNSDAPVLRFILCSQTGGGVTSTRWGLWGTRLGCWRIDRRFCW